MIQLSPRYGLDLEILWSSIVIIYLWLEASRIRDVPRHCHWQDVFLEFNIFPRTISQLPANDVFLEIWKKCADCKETWEKSGPSADQMGYSTRCGHNSQILKRETNSGKFGCIRLVYPFWRYEEAQQLLIPGWFLSKSSIRARTMIFSLKALFCSRPSILLSIFKANFRVENVVWILYQCSCNCSCNLASGMEWFVSIT